MFIISIAHEACLCAINVTEGVCDYLGISYDAKPVVIRLFILAILQNIRLTSDNEDI